MAVECDCDRELGSHPIGDWAFNTSRVEMLVLSSEEYHGPRKVEVTQWDVMLIGLPRLKTLRVVHLQAHDREISSTCCTGSAKDARTPVRSSRFLNCVSLANGVGDSLVQTIFGRMQVGYALEEVVLWSASNRKWMMKVSTKFTVDGEQVHWWTY